MKRNRFAALIIALFIILNLSVISVAEEDGSFEIKTELLPILSLIDTENSGKMRMSYRAAMPNGRAILTTSISYEGKTYTTEEIKAALPAVQQNLSGIVSLQDEGLLQSDIVMVYGAEMVHATTNFILSSDSGSLPVQAELYIVSVQDLLVEQWILSPAASLYEGNDTALGELESDLLLAQNSIVKDSSWEGYVNGHVNMLTGQLSLTASTAATETKILESEDYTDPEGHFTLKIPKGAIILTPASSAEEIAAVREAYLTAYPDGGSRVFDLLEDDIHREGGTLIFTADYCGLVEIFREEHPEYINRMTLETLATGCTDVETNLIKEYGEASLLCSYEMETVSGLTHTRALFSLKSGEISLKMAMLDTFTESGVLWEPDIFATDDELFDALYRLIVDSLQYTDSAAAETKAE